MGLAENIFVGDKAPGVKNFTVPLFDCGHFCIDNEIIDRTPYNVVQMRPNRHIAIIMWRVWEWELETVGEWIGQNISFFLILTFRA